MWHLQRLSQWRAQGRPKCAKNVLKWRTFKLASWITGKSLKIDGYMLRCVWQAIIDSSFSSMWHLPRLSQWRTQGRLKCAALDSLDVAKCFHPQRVKATTYRRDSREVAKFYIRLIAETNARSVGNSHPCLTWEGAMPPFPYSRLRFFCRPFSF